MQEERPKGATQTKAPDGYVRELGLRQPTLEAQLHYRRERLREIDEFSARLNTIASDDCSQKRGSAAVLPVRVRTPRRSPQSSGRPAARRSSTRAGRDGPDSDSDGEPEPPSRRLTFADIRLAGALAGIPPHRQLRFFNSLPEGLRAEAWSALAEGATR